MVYAKIVAIQWRGYEVLLFNVKDILSQFSFNEPLPRSQLVNQRIPNKKF